MRRRSVNKKQSSGPTLQCISRWKVLFKRIGDFCETIGASIDVSSNKKLLHSEQGSQSTLACCLFCTLIHRQYQFIFIPSQRK